MIYTFLMEKAKELPFWIFYNPYQIGHDFYIEEFGYGVCTPKWIFAETRKNNLLQIVFDGIAHVSVGQCKPFVVREGEAFYLPANVSHWYEADEKFPTTRAWISWSGEQIANTPCGMKMPSFKTIYRWIDERYLRSTLKNLRRKGKTRKRLGNGGRFTTGKSIRKRDKSVYNRKEFGHWEADTVVSGQGKSKVCFATLAERKTRYYIAIKIPNRKGETMAKAIIDALSQFPKEAVKTITCDRGSEFACWREIEKALGCDMYFADPYCAWQKGTNENLNGLLREFYPKGRNLSRVSPATLKKNLALINARPKKVLHYQTPQDLFEQNLSMCCF